MFVHNDTIKITPLARISSVRKIKQTACKYISQKGEDQNVEKDRKYSDSYHYRNGNGSLLPAE
jgi:hypothetical protein